MAVLEMPVHIGVHEAEDDGLVAHKRLVMALGIGDSLLVLAAVGHLEEDMTGFPVFILDLLDIFDPEIGNTHRQTIVETDAAVLYLRCQARHAAHLFGDRDGIGFDLMNHFVGKGKIHDGITVFVTVEIRAVAVEVFPQTVRAVDHRGHAVKTITVEIVFVEPELAVREQEMEHFVLAVVEAQTVPCRVLTATAVMEILIARAVEIAQTLQLVLHYMAVHEVHDDMNTPSVRVVDEGFQLIRRTETTGSREEIGHMVSERTVVRVLLDSHYLDAVITQFGDTRQYVTTELLVRIDFLLLGRHTNMTFVDIQPAFLFEFLTFVLPLELGFVPYLGGEDFRLLVLYHAAHIRRDTLSVTAVPLHEQFVHLTVLHSTLRQLGFPHAVTNRLQTIVLVFLPTVHVAFDVDGGRIRCPLTKHPTLFGVMQAEE